MPAVEIARALARAQLRQAIRIAVQLHPEEWNRVELAADLGAVLPAELAEEVARFVIASAPTKPRGAILANLLQDFRVESLLEPEPARETPDRPLVDLAAVAAMLDVTVPELEWFADTGSWLRHSSRPLRHYRVRRMSKPAGGVRVIEAPKPRLCEAQRRILRHVLDAAAPHPAARGFLPGGSVLRYAEPHVGAGSVIRLDLKDCFTTVGASRVRAVFHRLGYPNAVARVLAALCTTETPADELHGLDAWQAATLRFRHLPQGAPTSPTLMNLSLRQLDSRLTGLARAQGARYTRYGDDLAFSGAPDASLIAGVVPKIVAAEGFAVNPRKTRIMRRGSRQELAGLVVNDRAQVPRHEYDALRALLHNAARFGPASQNRDGHDDFRGHVYGRIAWVGQGNRERRERLLALAERVPWE
ncbi:RNA-directed DNA polymerase OS=Tsukamurella paurometabola (strain ATCC 8368 / DSM / CCUG 35730/ CIP 100753 / JCM 10117 / KCTC 9821 / NBRC 16120 / NCIMB 702349 / NCTC 13040) OX=521096 GN=Tpau_2444 PE=3 SV=1 [Tsukamurella paurometabola]|uniref:RNA-directed DNA polymerase n=1 Tax=Tsukamurella paurometabola (strain ATCC 8368 / DSM 20162 / CCUG 35730 / CIP 100753 / JCM 10117 / KCTC 9821 / NBRC 16120 / NCIMB 702349 / NCTC 13040) TaxID=521096 RepID=D5UR60_TSUPD|nr:reverse transcriptase family protein [Tsukamurella paurometabola]ADG79049.1 hypothetical protein Tpau_2444 [Tsukamurella paurometabola DSM 20162]SUP33894.1 Retron-type reverse transcriptase [Tsukamurella paurometabola]